MNCGRRGVAAERFCTACGTELGDDAPRTLSRVRVGTPTTQLRAIRSLPCPHCARSVARDTPFCPHCGLRLEGGEPALACGECGARPPRAGARFCASCGAPFPLPTPASAVVQTPRSVRRFDARLGAQLGAQLGSQLGAQLGAPLGAPPARLALIDDTGNVLELIPSRRGGEDGAQSLREQDTISIAPLAGCGSMFVFVTEPHVLRDDDLLLIGSQTVRFRIVRGRAATAGGAATALLTRAQPPRDAAVLEQLRPDGSVRDRIFIQAGRRILIGRTVGDLVFPYDQTVSGRHAELAPSAVAQGAEAQGDGDAGGSEWVVRDLGSRNGTGVAVRAPRQLRTGERLLVGGQLMRVESR